MCSVSELSNKKLGVYCKFIHGCLFGAQIFHIFYLFVYTRNNRIALRLCTQKGLNTEPYIKKFQYLSFKRGLIFSLTSVFEYTA